MKSVVERVAESLDLTLWKVEAVVSLSEEGCTVPFIARYRKEKTGNLDEVQISSVLDEIKSLEELEKRRSYVLDFLRSEEKLESSLEKRILEASTLEQIEDLYLPFKPRRKTKADRAVELGLGPLADSIVKRNLLREAAVREAAGYKSTDLPTAEDALEGALDIVVQAISDNADVRSYVRERLSKGNVESGVKRGKKEEGETYRDYFEYSERVERVKPHRVMAVLRGEKEGILNLKVEPFPEADRVAERIMYLHFNRPGELFRWCAAESFSRHLHQTIGREVLRELGRTAEENSVEIFRKNLEKILLAAPFGEKPVIGIDPGIRTGCKAVVLDRGGKLLENRTLFLNRKESDADILLSWAEKYGVKGVAVGDGTFGREAERIIRKRFEGGDVVVTLVDEDGASIYSASETAREEFPDLDLTVRGSISIGRRFQDPMAELVKIEPKSLGVGQYQHDITPKLLQEKLSNTVEWAVNRVGININTASYHLLSYISGLDRKKAKAIVERRSSDGPFKSRDELKKVKGIGAKAFQQCAGFLMVKDGENILDSTGVHPESYDWVRKIADFTGCSVEKIVRDPKCLNRRKIEVDMNVPELNSILEELERRGLDIREEFKTVSFREDIETMEDLTEEMVLNGVVDNVVAFGAFVDIGIKEKGLVHVSEISDTFVDDPNSVLHVGQKVRVKVIGLDSGRRRISLSIKKAD